MNREEALNKVFDYLEENKLIRYTKKFNRSRIVPALAQTEVPTWQYLGYSAAAGLSYPFNRYILNNKKSSQPWAHYLFSLLGMKYCTICRDVLSISKFNIGRPSCISCKKLYDKEYNYKNREYRKTYDREYQIKNKERIKSAKLEYRTKNKETIKASDKEYRAKNKDRIKVANKEYRQNNKDALARTRKVWVANNQHKCAAYSAKEGQLS